MRQDATTTLQPLLLYSDSTGYLKCLLTIALYQERSVFIDVHIDVSIPPISGL